MIGNDRITNYSPFKPFLHRPCFRLITRSNLRAWAIPYTMDDLGYNDSQHPPSEVHIAGDHMSRGERMSSPIPDSPLSSAPNSAPSSPGHQHPSLHGYTGDLDSVDELKDGLNEAGRLLNLPELDHEKPHRMETDPGMIPILLPVPSTKSEAPFDEAGLEAVAPTASPVVFSPIPVRSKPKNTLWKRENHHNNDDNDDYEDDEDNLLSSSHPRSSPVSLQQRRLMKNRRQSANMKLNTSNISSSSSIPNTTGGGSQHQQLNLNSPSTISVQQQDPKQSKADIVSRAKQVMARRSSATLPFEDEIVVNVNSNDDDDDDEIPDDERRATSRSSMNSGTPPHQFSGRVSNATAIAIGSGLALALSPRDEQREVPMDEPDPPSPVRSLPDSSDFDLVDDLQQQAPSMDVAPSMDEARPIRLHGSVAAATSSKSFDYEDDYQHQHSYLDESFLPNRSVKHQPKAIVSITTTATASVLSPAHTVQTARLSPGLHVTTTDAVQVQEGNEIDDDGGGFETHIVPPAPDSPFSDQQSAVSKVDESFYSSDGSLEKYRDEEVEISFNDDNSYTDDDDEDDPLSGILDPGQFPRMAAKAFVSAQTDFTNFIMGRPGMEEEDSASPTRSEVEPPLPRRKPEPTGSQVVSKLLPTGGQVISKLEPTRGQVVSKSEPMGDQVVSKLEPTGGQAVSKSEPRGGQVVTNSKPIGGQVMMNSESTGDQVIPTALLARDHYQDTAAAAAAAAIYNSDGDTGFGWVDDLVHESVGLVGKMAVSDTFKSFKAAAVSDQIQSGVCMPLDFADSTTVAPKGVQRIEQGSSLTPKLAKSFSSISSGSSVADDDSKTRLSRGQILDDLVAKSMEEAETVNGSPVRKNGKDGVWWLELELSKREAVKQAGGPLGSAEKAMAIGARDDNFQKAAAPQAKTSPSKRSSKDSQQGKPKPSKFWQGVRIKRSEQYNEVMSDEEEREQVMADGLGEGSGTDSMAKYDMKSTVESPLPKEPPSLRRSSNTFDADLSLDDVPPRDDEPPSLRPLSSNAPSSIKSVQPPSLTAPEDEPPFLSPSASLSPSNDDQRLASNPLHQSGSGGNTALSPDDNDDDDDAASHSMDVLMNSLDDMVNSLEALTPTGLQEHAKSNDVERVKSPQEDIPTPKQRVRADPDAISNGSPIEDISTRSQRVRADPDAISNGKLILVESIDNDFGIPIGDIMISLLNEDTDVSWASRVHEAIWRCRTMRRNFDSKYLQGKHEHQPGNPSVGRTSVPVDVDDARMIGGVGSVSKTQGAAQEHLR
jgi:hypothetical protein